VRLLVFLLLVACATPSSTPVRPSPASTATIRQPSPWRSLFDGRALGSWRATSFGGEGTVRVENGTLLLDQGETLTGVTWAGAPPPTNDYELRVQAMKVAGDDFFCGLTFPVGASHASLIVGGWGGTVVGISSLDGLDASDNETSRIMNFQRGRWYRIRVRVAGERITAWIDDAQVVDVSIAGRDVSLRAEVAPSRPLGIATWRTAAAVRAIDLRTL
jgi:hypothetical protein